MSATTISAVLGKLGGIAERRSAFGELTGASSFDDVDLELGSAMIDADHDQRRRGEVVHAEIGETGQLAVVGVLDGGDWLAEVEEPVYLSGTYEMRGKNVMQDFCVAREAQVLGVSVTLSSANLDARPLRWYRGDLRSSADRAQWPISVGSSDPLLGRAIEHCSRELRHRSATRIVDLRPRDDNPRRRGRADRLGRAPPGSEAARPRSESTTRAAAQTGVAEQRWLPARNAPDAWHGPAQPRALGRLRRSQRIAG
jgi:hypothetical protein